ncbi:hypothetical protein BJ944DRAFT_239993 [Cunninghamella echinulata]|nr:hypothetical protein BJ944DRAFT_239993 [Cunninghamella echinulata]
MSNKASEIVGSIKETVGQWTGSERLESEGNAQKNSSKVQGHVDNAKGSANEYVESAKDKVSGAYDGVKASNNNSPN